MSDYISLVMDGMAGYTSIITDSIANYSKLITVGMGKHTDIILDSINANMWMTLGLFVITWVMLGVLYANLTRR